MDLFTLMTLTESTFCVINRLKALLTSEYSTFHLSLHACLNGREMWTT